MKLGTFASGFGKKHAVNMELVHQAERLGYDSVWTAEAYGNDAVTTATWILAQTQTIKVGTAIMQMPARTPAMAAMTSTTLTRGGSSAVLRTCFTLVSVRGERGRHAIRDGSHGEVPFDR